MVCLKRHPFLYCLANIVLGSTPQSLDRAIAQPNEKFRFTFQLPFFFFLNVLYYRIKTPLSNALGEWLASRHALHFTAFLGNQQGGRVAWDKRFGQKNDTTTHKTEGFLFNLLLALLREIILLV